ncbi:MAG: 3-deoxy-D-manno-octulosonic acid transferase, partial [Bacteroidales bacterium]|nr:3-deoxy-D-manno-octulosonic acid transferase [Bacteroidales bacterium]
MSFLYNTGIAVYVLLIRLAALFNSKAKAWVQGRKDWRTDLSGAFQKGDKVAWFHAASLGEFEQGRPVMEAFRQEHPEYKILLTFFSPSGYLQKKDYDGADKVMYLPPDCPGNAKYFVENLNPDIAVFIKYEFWYNYLSELKKHNVSSFFISALFRKGQPFFKWYGGWFRKKLRRVDHFFVQDQVSADNLKSIGIDQVTLSGDTRFDRVADILKNNTENPDIEKFCAGSKVLLAGSTWPPDEELLAGLPERFPDLKLIIAPHEVKEERVEQLINALKTDVARYTEDEPGDWPDKQILVIDTIGVLSSIYRYADIAYIGGAFGTGLHNIQEPAVNGMPVIFGPNYHKFKEAVDLVDIGGAFTINSGEELQTILSELL